MPQLIFIQKQRNKTQTLETISLAYPGYPLLYPPLGVLLRLFHPLPVSDPYR